MGTRCLTVFNDTDGKEIVTLYRQFDGYPESHGEDLKEYLAGKRIVNGLSGDRAVVFNGMGCLAASVVAHFKTEPGGFYLYPAGTRDCGEEFIYTVYQKDKAICLRVQAGCVTFFGMPGTKANNMPVLYDGPIDQFTHEQCDKVHAEVAKEIPNDFIESQKEGA